MKKSIYYSFIFGTLCLGLASSCSNKPKEPEVAKMESKQDSLKKLNEDVSIQIERLKQSMAETDKQFETKN